MAIRDDFEVVAGQVRLVLHRFALTVLVILAFAAMLIGKADTVLVENARVLALDLADRNAADAIKSALQRNDCEAQYVVNNAGFSVIGPAAELDRAEQLAMIDVNMRALLDLSLAFTDDLIKHRGGILNVGSLAGVMPGPCAAVHYASKAFVVSFSHAIASELKGTGVTVTVLCPGPTRTEFASAAGIEDSQLFRGPAMSAETVARQGYAAMLAGRAECIAGARNRWMMRGVRLVPRTILSEVARRLNSSVQ